MKTYILLIEADDIGRNGDRIAFNNLNEHVFSSLRELDSAPPYEITEDVSIIEVYEFTKLCNSDVINVNSSYMAVAYVNEEAYTKEDSKTSRPLTDKERELNDLEGYDNDMCPNCASKETWRNSCGGLQCDNCGYTEEE